MQELSNLTELHRNQLEVEAPFIWLYELETSEVTPRRYRITNFEQRVGFDANSAGERLIYEPAPVVHGDIQQNTEGSLPTITVTVANTGPILGTAFDDADGFVGQPFRIILVSAYELDNPEAALIQDGEVTACSISRDSITLSVSAFNLYQQEFPPFVFARRRCRYSFGTGACGYRTDAVGAAFTDCAKTIEACTARGADETSRGLVAQHPSRFGAFPGVPR